MKSIAADLLREAAARHGLVVEFLSGADGELVGVLPAQLGLDWPLSLELRDGDELRLRHPDFDLDFIPAFEPRVQGRLLAVLSALVDGRIGLRCAYRGAAKPHRVELVVFETGEVLHSCGRVGFGRTKRRMLLRNGRLPQPL